MECLLQVVMAMRTKGGNEAVFQSLHRLVSCIKTGCKRAPLLIDLLLCFAECAIVEAHPSKTEPSAHNVDGPSVPLDAHENFILAETESMLIVLDAFSDGSSFICL
ncbi:conserved hypothetical protein [Ricinus communis]|uniref:C2HC zinc finger plants domain-containing protein n=1 Tax=Ricinus communis TaxID=3988 RepID=B9SHT1_RICCO|nr:conserved hypothetical protein [Ricinus communis]